MIIRKYEKRDFKPLVHMYRSFFGEMRERQGWKRLKIDEDEAADIAKESLNSSSWVFVAEDQDDLAGFARVQLWDDAHFVREVFVDKRVRRRGVGSKLLAKCEDLVRKEGETSIYLTVEPQHSVSLRFLAANGYDTLNMLELRKDFVKSSLLQRKGDVEVLGHKLRLLKRRSKP